MTIMDRRTPRPVFAVGLCLLLALVGCSEAELSPQERLAQIDKQWQAGDVSAALIALKNAVRASPADPALRQRLAEMYLRLGNPEAAQAEIEKGAESGLDKRSVEILNIRLAVLRAQADVALAKFETDPSIADDPQLKALHAEILGIAGKLDEAKALYTEAVSVPNPPAAALQGLARVLTVRNELKPARESLDKAIAADATDWNSFMFDAELRERENNIDGARQSLHKAARLNPFVIFPALAEVRLDIGEQKFDAAKERLAALDKRVGKNPIVAYYKAIVAYLAEDYAAAEDGFRQILAMSPNHPQSQLYMGYLMYREGNLEQAENFLTVYRQLAPDYEPARKMLASIQLKRLKPDEALKTLGELGADPDAEILGLKASAYFAVGNSEAGLASLKAAAEREPQDPKIKTALAFATARLGKYDDAIAMLEPDAPLDKQLTQKDTMLLYLYMTRKEWDKVIETGEKMRVSKGNDPGLLNALASAYVGKGDVPKAVELLKVALAASPKTPTLLSNMALLLMRQGDVAGGSKYVDQLLEIDGADGANLTLAGAAADARGDTAAAIGYYERVRAGNPKATVARLALATHYAQAQDYTKAVQVASETLQLMPGNVDATLALGHGLRGLGKLDDAEKVARAALKSDPKSPNAQFLLGTILFDSGEFAEAEKELSRAKQGLPDSAEVSVVLAKTLIRKGGAQDLSAAETLINGLDKGEKGSAVTSALRGELATVKGDHVASASFYEAALKLDDSDAWAMKQAKALLEAKQSDAAVTLLQERSTTHPKSIDVMLYLAQLLQQFERRKEAVATYEKVLALNAGQLIALNNLALLELELGMPNDIEHAKAAYDLSPGTPQLADTYGWILFKRGKLELALDILQSAARAAPDDGGIQFHYAVVLVSQGSTEEARAALKRALGRGDFPERKAAEQLASELKL